MLMVMENKGLPGSNLNANQYDFILNPQKSKKNSFDPKQRSVLYIAGGVLVVVIIIVLVISLLGGGSNLKTSYAQLQKQQLEIIRLIDGGGSKLRDYNINKFTTITKLTIESEQLSYSSYFQKKGVKLSKKEAELTVEEKKANTKRDNLLKTAESTGNYDTTFDELIKQQLSDYKLTLNKLYQQSSNPETKDILKSSNENVNLLLQSN